MNKPFRENREIAKIAELTRKYQADGYQVLAALDGYEQPYLIHNLRPDLIIKKGDEIIIIEVKTKDSARTMKDSTGQLARYVREIPGARFDLVLTNPKPLSSIYTKSEALEVEVTAVLNGMLTDIKDAISQNQLDIVPLMAVRILEGLFSRLAVIEIIDLPPLKWNLLNLSNKLADEKVITYDVREFAHSLYEKRNAFIHQRERNRLTSKKEAQMIYRKVNRLVNEWGGMVKMPEDISCPVCEKVFNSYLNLARHMVLKDRPGGEHIQWLEQLLNQPFVEFGWKSDKKISTALKRYFSSNR